MNNQKNNRCDRKVTCARAGGAACTMEKTLTPKVGPTHIGKGNVRAGSPRNNPGLGHKRFINERKEKARSVKLAENKSNFFQR
jgi:hypothetical protein